MTVKAKEAQNQIQFDNYKSQSVMLGPYTMHIWNTDPRHLGFLLARYKFCAKMLAGKKYALDAGCGDAFGIPVILQVVERVHGVDWEPLLMEDNRQRMSDYNCTFECIDLSECSPSGEFDSAYSLDVIEHVPMDKEHLFMTNICNTLNQQSVFVMGTPNITSEKYASEASRAGHINLKTHKTLYELMGKYFHNVFIFSMNDEVVHTGYSPMAHYLIAVGVGKK